MDGRKHFKKYFLIDQDEYSRYKKKMSEGKNSLPDLSVSPELIQAEKERKKLQDNLLDPSLSTEDKLLYHGQLSRKFLQDLNELRNPQKEIAEQLKHFVRLAEQINSKNEDVSSSDLIPSETTKGQQTEVKKERKVEDLSPPKRKRVKAKTKVEENPDETFTPFSSPQGVTTREGAQRRKKKNKLDSSPLIGPWKH